MTIDLDVVEAIMTVGFAVLYVGIPNDGGQYIIKYASKYMFLVSALLTSFEIWVQWGNLELITMLLFMIVMIFFVLVTDALQYIPIAMDFVRTKARR